MNIKISRSDIAKLDKKIKKLKEFDKRKLSKELGVTALDISLRAKKASRVGQDAGGTLRQSIRAEVKGKSVSVIAGAYYAPYVEFGTGSAVDLSDMLELGIPASYAEQFRGDGKKKVNLPARPFFFSSAREGLKSLLMRLNTGISKSIQ
jgi:HK97 gp10 family phage protein